MNHSLTVSMMLAAIPLALSQQGGTLAARLSDGVQLFYFSDGRAQPPWIVDSVRTGLALRPSGECAAMTVRRRPSDTKPERSKLCLSGDTLYRWEAAGKGWTPSRPVGPDMTLTVRRANGDRVLYETSALGEDLISGSAIQVVSTTITTVDSKGRPRLRIRERYAVSLATATNGTIEDPDPAAPGQWVIKHNYILKELRPGP